MARKIYYVTDPKTGKSTIVPRGDGGATSPEEAAARSVGAVGEQQWAALTTEQVQAMQERTRTAGDVLRQARSIYRTEAPTPEQIRSVALKDPRARTIQTQSLIEKAKKKQVTAITQKAIKSKAKLVLEKVGVDYEAFVEKYRKQYGIKVPSEAESKFLKRYVEITTKYSPTTLFQYGAEKFHRLLGMIPEKLVPRKEVETLPRKVIRGLVTGVTYTGATYLTGTPLLVITSPELQEFLEKPIESAKAIKEYIKQDPTGFAAEAIGSIVGAGLTSVGIKKFSKLLQKKALKVTDVRTVNVANEVLPEATLKTPYGNVKVRFDKAGNIKHFKIISGSSIEIRKYFGLGKKKYYYPKTIGAATVTNIDDVYYSQGKFITRLGKKQILSKLKAIGTIDDEYIKSISIGKIYRGKSIQRLTPQELLRFLRNQGKVIPKRGVTRSGFVAGEIGYEPTPPIDSAAMIISKAKVKELERYSALKFKPPYEERAITLIKRIPPEAELTKGFFIPKKVKPKVISKEVLAPFFAGLEKQRVEIVKAALIKPSKVKPVPMIKPKVIREVAPSPFAGLGLYEKTEPYGLLPFEIGSVKEELKPMMKITPAVRQITLLGLATKTQIKQIEQQRIKEIAKVQTAEQLAIKQVEKLQVVPIQRLRTVIKEVQRLRYPFGYFVPTVSVLKAPPTFIPIPKAPSERIKRIVKKLKKAQAYQAWLRVKGAKMFIGKPMLKQKAIQLGERATRLSLAATFGVIPTGKFVKGKELPYDPSKIFRAYRKIRGRRIPLKDIWIQKAPYRLSSLEERRAIQKARASAFFQTTKKSRGLRWL